MRRLVLPLAVALLAGCAHGGVQRQVTPLVGPPPQPIPPAEAKPVYTNNFVLTVSEAVADSSQDLPSQTRVYVDGKLAGQTDVSPKSHDKSWGAALPDGNHLFRFEQWVLPAIGEWAPLADQWQPRQRFIRIEPGQRTLVTLKFSANERRYGLQIARDPLPPAATE